MAEREAIKQETRRDLELLKAAGVLRGFYLAGGTGLAFLLHHRLSRDLDFFRKSAFGERELIERIRQASPFSLEKKTTGMVRGRFRRTLVSFFRYPYLLLEKPQKIDGIYVASLADIACMKLDAIASRGTKRDFIDVYATLARKQFSLKQLLAAYQKKYARLKPNLMHVKKSLVYFADAEGDPMPEMLLPVSWQRVEAFFSAEARKF